MREKTRGRAERRYSLVITITPRSNIVPAKITDGMNIIMSGRVDAQRLEDLVSRAREAINNSELCFVGARFGLNPPLR